MKTYTDSVVAYNRIANSIHTLRGIPSRKLSLSGWLDNARQIHEVIERINQEFDSDVSAIHETFKDAAAADKIRPLKEKKEALIKAAIKNARDDLEAVMTAKRKRLDEVMSPPSPEQAALLQVLSLRTSLSAAEVATAATKLTGNLVCLSALGDIARARGVDYPAIGVEEIEKAINKAEEIALQELKSIDKRDADMGYRERLTWCKTSKGEYVFCPSQAFFDPLDADNFTAVMQRNSESDTNGNQNSTDEMPRRVKMMAPDHNAVRIVMRGGEKATTVCLQFGCTLRELNACNPGTDLTRPFSQGDLIIVPRVEFSHLGEPGSIDYEQCVSCRFDPEHQKTFEPGQRVNVVEEEWK